MTHVMRSVACRPTDVVSSRQEEGYEGSNILFATSCCPDEINRDLDEEVQKVMTARPPMASAPFTPIVHTEPCTRGIRIWACRLGAGRARLGIGGISAVPQCACSPQAGRIQRCRRRRQA